MALYAEVDSDVDISEDERKAPSDGLSSARGGGGLAQDSDSDEYGPGESR